MSKKVHFLHYLVLAALFFLGFALFVCFSYQPYSQFLIVVFTVLAYILWGVSHHWLEKRLSWGVLVEYFLVGFIVILLFGLTLLR